MILWILIAKLIWRVGGAFEMIGEAIVFLVVIILFLIVFFYEGISSLIIVGEFAFQLVIAFIIGYLLYSLGGRIKRIAFGIAISLAVFNGLVAGAGFVLGPCEHMCPEMVGLYVLQTNETIRTAYNFSSTLIP